MNTFSAQKLGEVIAFCQVGADTLEQGRSALEGLYGDTVDDILEAHRKHEAEYQRFATVMDVEQTVNEKAAGTREKLEKMRGLYLSGEDWQDPTEIMEWSGFFEGAIIVHLRVVEGVAEKRGLQELRDITTEALTYHESMLNSVGAIIQDVTADRIGDMDA